MREVSAPEVEAVVTGAAGAVMTAAATEGGWTGATAAVTVVRLAVGDTFVVTARAVPLVTVLALDALAEGRADSMPRMPSAMMIASVPDRRAEMGRPAARFSRGEVFMYPSHQPRIRGSLAFPQSLVGTPPTLATSCQRWAMV